MKKAPHIYYDEFSTFPDYKWWRNPIQWYRWRRIWKAIDKQARKPGWTSSNHF